MIKYIVVLIMLFTNSAFAEEPVQLILENHRNGLKLTIKNVSKKSILINQRFALGGIYDESEVEFEIVNKEGISFPLQVQIKITCRLSEEDIILLKPGITTFQYYQISRLVSYYGLTSGQYRVKAKYKSECGLEKGIFEGSLESNWVAIEVKE